MTFPFNPSLGTILVWAEITGPTGKRTIVALSLDTGASTTSINLDCPIRVGYDPTLFPANVAMTTGSGVINVPRFPVAELASLGQARCNFPVLAHTLPPTAVVEGLLGLDFLQGQLLTLDFVKGEITLTPATGPTP
ncbi:MAG TPA: retroviral-like aspartic protease family protein [Gemmataceae bacterium]|jgi:aspartyl protease family protein|nr:retroviral-like aspartic protease family protein [Gemmataceae bacterium]